MHKDGDEIHETPTEARAGVNVKGMTTVLIASTILVVVGFVIIYYLA